MWETLWFGSGLLGAFWARWALRRISHEPVTLGTLVGIAVGIAVGPLSVVMAVIWTLGWLFSGPPTHYESGQWPEWWLRVRYRQHRIWRWIWHLGYPPEEEDLLSDWRGVMPPK